MSTKAVVLPVGDNHSQYDMPEPHEFVGVITEEFPVVKIKCSCGYNGLSIVQDGKTVCSACIGRADYHKQQLGQTVNQTSASEVAVAQMVDDAVRASVGPLMDMIAKLQSQLELNKQKPEGGKD